MTPIIVLSLPEDEARIRPIVGALDESDLDIYWDRTPPDSHKYRETAELVLKGRGAVIFWSASAAASDAEPFRQLARRALAAGKAICVQLDTGAIPPDMRDCTVYDLRGRRARGSSLFLMDLVAGVKAKAAGLDPPLPRAARQLLFRRLALVVPSAITLFALAIGLYRDTALDRIAGLREARAWSEIRPGSCDDLRRFLRLHSDGVHAAEAQALLDGRRTGVRRYATSERLELPLQIAGVSEAGLASRAAAEGAARERARRDAARACLGLAAAAQGTVRDAQPLIEGTDCERFSSGYVCGARGRTVCSIVRPVEEPTERCDRSR